MKVAVCVAVLVGLSGWKAKSLSALAGSLLVVGAFSVGSLSGGVWVSYWGWGDQMGGVFVSLCLWLGGLMLLASDQLRSGECAFVVAVMSLEIFLLFAFMARSFLSFYMFFEAALVPTLFLVLGWGYQPERVQAGAYLMLYTVGASLPLLVGILQLHAGQGGGSFLLSYWVVPLTWGGVGWWFLSMGAFLVKTPLYSLHLWLPKAHVEAPVAGSMALAGVLLKLGGYGMLRVSEHVAFANLKVLGVVGAVSLCGGCVAGGICLRQTDLKGLIAYSSVAHMGLVVVGVLSMSVWGWVGGLAMMIAHGLVSSSLFAVANVCYQSVYSRSLYLVKGALGVSPAMGLMLFVALAANMGAPPSLNLQSEIMLVMGIMAGGFFFFFPLGVGLFFSAAFSLLLFVSASHGSGGEISSGWRISERAVVCNFLHLVPIYLGLSKAELWVWL